jgi:hypothetical protein
MSWDGFFGHLTDEYIVRYMRDNISQNTSVYLIHQRRETRLGSKAEARRPKSRGFAQPRMKLIWYAV